MVKTAASSTRLDAATGRLVSDERLPAQGNYYASPVAGDGKVYFASEAGVVSVVADAPEWRVISSTSSTLRFTAPRSWTAACVHPHRNHPLFLRARFRRAVRMRTVRAVPTKSNLHQDFQRQTRALIPDWGKAQFFETTEKEKGLWLACTSFNTFH